MKLLATTIVAWLTYFSDAWTIVKVLIPVFESTRTMKDEYHFHRLKNQLTSFSSTLSTSSSHDRYFLGMKPSSYFDFDSNNDFSSRREDRFTVRKAKDLLIKVPFSMVKRTTTSLFSSSSSSGSSRLSKLGKKNYRQKLRYKRHDNDDEEDGGGVSRIMSQNVDVKRKRTKTKTKTTAQQTLSTPPPGQPTSGSTIHPVIKQKAFKSIDRIPFDTERKRLHDDIHEEDDEKVERLLQASQQQQEVEEEEEEEEEMKHLLLQRKDDSKLNVNKVITTAHELRSAVLDHGIPLQDLNFDVSCFRSKTSKDKPKTLKNTLTTTPTNAMEKQTTNKSSSIESDVVVPFDHEVLKLIEKRFKTKSKPGSRAIDDNDNLALSIEGGGMRGAVSAGMASAISVLGLSDCFDSIYGSSAGSVVGAYFVSRQMCIDVYTQVLTAAKKSFVCKLRLASSLASNLLDQALNNTIFSKNLNPAMNISFVLDSIMDPNDGLRPLDMEMFRLNDQRQPLRIVTSCVRDGKMETQCLGSREMDFFDVVHNETGAILASASSMADGKRHGLFACLETSMTVPAATGPPLPLLRHKDLEGNLTSRCFDAFCYEPIPYRSAVEEGATHVLVLKTRPEGNPIGTAPGLFEKVFAPMYFDSHNMPQVSRYFEKGGQQYVYVEDYLTLDEGKNAGKDGVVVPPTKLLYGIEKDQEALSFIQNRHLWKRAHLLPISVPAGTPELSTLSVDTDEVLEAVQHGFAVAFDLLAPLTGIKLNSHLNGKRVAQLIFAKNPTSNSKIVLREPMVISGDPITSQNNVISIPNVQMSRHSPDSTSFESSSVSFEAKAHVNKHNSYHQNHEENYLLSNSNMIQCPTKRDCYHLLEILPGLNSGKMTSLSHGLYHQINKT